MCCLVYNVLVELSKGRVYKKVTKFIHILAENGCLLIYFAVNKTWKANLHAVRFYYNEKGALFVNWN